MTTGDRKLGFAGMIAAGIDPKQAWDEIHQTCKAPEIRVIFEQLGQGPEGQAALEYSRQMWAKHGFPAPWDPEAEVT